jgi:diguanylate cyclase (GGDEF)-like protein
VPADVVNALLVTCDPLHAAAWKRALGDAGAVAVAAPSVDQALAMVPRERREVELVLFDLAPGELQNVACIAKLARRFPTASIVVIAAEDNLELALQAGASDGLTRPVRKGELTTRLRSVLRARNAEVRRVARERKFSEAMDKLQRQNRDLERLVCADPLTGVANRRHVLALLDAECKRASRDSGPLSIAMLDLDHFHEFNEQYGHPGGDRCLVRVAEALVHSLRRPSDLIGRYGGEELIAILPSTDAAGASVVAERLRAAVQDLAIPHARSSCAPVVTISVGVASFNRQISAAEPLIVAADSAMLRAKTAGRNRVVGEVVASTVVRLPAHRWKRFAPVIADPWFADRIPAFLQMARDDAVRVSNNPTEATTFARKLEASAADHGFDQLRRLGLDLEAATRISEVNELIDEVIQYVDHVQVVYRRPLDEKRTAE